MEIGVGVRLSWDGGEEIVEVRMRMSVDLGVLSWSGIV